MFKKNSLEMPPRFVPHGLSWLRPGRLGAEVTRRP